jgi:hypothetical protein
MLNYCPHMATLSRHLDDILGVQWPPPSTLICAPSPDDRYMLPLLFHRLGSPQRRRSSPGLAGVHVCTSYYIRSSLTYGVSRHASASQPQYA